MTSGTNSKVLVIERARWRRGGPQGEGIGITALLNREGYMCCLGFDAIACGLAPVDISGYSSPARIMSKYSPLDARPRVTLLAQNTPAVCNAMEVNDEVDIPDDVREANVRQAMKHLGYDDVQFV